MGVIYVCICVSMYVYVFVYVYMCRGSIKILVESYFRERIRRFILYSFFLGSGFIGGILGYFEFD